MIKYQRIKYENLTHIMSLENSLECDYTVSTHCKSQNVILLFYLLLYII